MNKLCIFVATTVLGTIGWSLGERFGIMTAYWLSGVGSLIGVYVGWRINRDFLQ
jgi:putative Mn2+ efflux pump MntP